VSPPVNKRADAVVIEHYKRTTTREIARMLGVSTQAVHLRAHRLGIADPQPKLRKPAPSIVETALAGRTPLERMWQV